MNKQMINLSVITVSFNTKRLLEVMLKSLLTDLRKSSLTWEVIVVDNDSQDGSADMVQKKYPEVKLLRSRENLGYAKANNMAIKEARGFYILLLNSDTRIIPGTVDNMIKYMNKNPKVGVSTCRVNLGNGRLDPACHRGFPTPWASLTYFLGLERIFPKVKLFSGYHLTYLDLATIHEIDSPAGAFYLVRRKVLDQVGFLDEDYFMYAEDLDWSYRIKQAGWEIMFVPQVSIIHLKKESGRKSESLTSKKKATAAFYDTMKIFYRKHYQEKYPSIIAQLTFLTIEGAKRLVLWRL